MHYKIVMFLAICILLFSLQGFSQTTEKSEHPLLDKYYPRPQNIDTNKTIATHIKPLNETKLAPTITTIHPVTNKPHITTIPTVTTTNAEIITPAATTTPSVKNIPVETTIPTITTTPSVNKPDTLAARIPVGEKVQTKPPSAPVYIDTRLGSSTKAYDTWEKNNNGAGSVTTSPK